LGKAYTYLRYGTDMENMSLEGIQKEIDERMKIVQSMKQSAEQREAQEEALALHRTKESLVKGMSSILQPEPYLAIAHQKSFDKVPATKKRSAIMGLFSTGCR